MRNARHDCAQRERLKSAEEESQWGTMERVWGYIIFCVSSHFSLFFDIWELTLHLAGTIKNILGFITIFFNKEFRTVIPCFGSQASISKSLLIERTRQYSKIALFILFLFYSTHYFTPPNSISNCCYMDIIDFALPSTIAKMVLRKFNQTSAPTNRMSQRDTGVTPATEQSAYSSGKPESRTAEKVSY